MQHGPGFFISNILIYANAGCLVIRWPYFRSHTTLPLLR
jgi:hypothetical protein